MGSKRKNRRKKKELAKRLAGPGPDEYADWGPKEKPYSGEGLHWLNTLTPAEQRQFDAEVAWATRAAIEDVPGPRRLNVEVDFGYRAYGRGTKP